MFGFLRKKLEEGFAQVNPFDGGKTAATVRAARSNTPPAQTVRQPAKYGVLARNPNAVNQSIQRGNDTPRQDTRSLWSKSFDTINPLDDGRSWNTATPNRSNGWRQQLFDTASNAFDMQMDPYRYVGNAGGRALDAVTGNRLDEATKRLNESQAQITKTYSDLRHAPHVPRNLQQGVIDNLNRQAQVSADLNNERLATEEATDPRRFAANTASIGFDVATLGTGGAGVKAGRAALPRLAARGAAEGAAGGFLGAAGAKDVTPSTLLAGTALGAGLGGGLPLAGHAAGKVTTSLVTNRIPLDEVGGISIRNPEGADFGGLKINNPDNARIGPVAGNLPINNPMDASFSKPLRVRNNTGAPLLGEGLSGAAQQSFEGARPTTSLVSRVKSRITPLNEIGAVGRNVLDEEPKPKGFIVKETKPRAGRVDTARISMGENGLRRTIQSELSPKEVEMGRALGLSDEQLVRAKRGVDQFDEPRQFKESKQPLPQAPQRVEPPIQPRDIADKAVNKDFVDTTNKFLGGKEAKKTRNTNIVRNLPNLDKNQSMDLMDAIESGSTSGAFKNIPSEIRNLLDAKHQELRKAGVDIGYLENYFPHKWQNEEAVRKAYESLNLKAGIQNARELPTIAEGVKLGYKPATTDYRKAIKAYLDTADRLLENRSYFDRLKKQGLIAESGTRPAGMQVIDAPGLPNPRPFIDADTGAQIQGNYYASPAVAKKLNKLFGDNSPSGAFEKTLDKTAKAASVAQDIGLSGGIPFTPVNAFTIAQGTKEILSGNLKSPIVATMKSFSKDGFNKYVDNNKPIVEALQRHGISLRTDYNLNSLADEVAEASGLKGKSKAALSAAWGKAFNDPTFRRFMPTLQVEMAKKIIKKQLKKGATQEAAEETAAQAIKNFYGVNTLAKESFRNQTGSNAATTVLFAPKYRESMINFWVNNAKALHPKNITKPEYRNNLKFIAGAGVSYAVLDALNKQQTGGHLWDNPDDKKDKALITGGPGGKDVGLPFLSSIATVPRNVVNTGIAAAKGDSEGVKKGLSSFLGFGIRPLMDAFVTNENYFGDKIVEEGSSPLDTLKQRAGYLATQYQHPYVREGIRTAQGKNKSWQEAASKASELPLRWYDPRYYTYNGEFNPRGPEGQKFTIAEQKQRAGIKAEVKSLPDKLGLNDKQKADYQSLKSVEFDDKGNIKFSENPFYTAQRATKLLDDKVFEVVKREAELNKRLNGKPIDPLFKLGKSERVKLLQKRLLPPGAKDPELSNLWKKTWYQDYQNQQSKYQSAKAAFNKKMGYADPEASKNPYPETPKKIQVAMDKYSSLPKGTGARSAWIRSNPQAWAAMTSQWEKVDQWENKERNARGLAATEGKKGIQNGFKEDSTKQYASSTGGRRRTGGRRSSGRRGGRGGKRSPRFDYTKNLFATNSTVGSNTTSKTLRKILEEAILKA